MVCIAAYGQAAMLEQIISYYVTACRRSMATPWFLVLNFLNKTSLSFGKNSAGARAVAQYSVSI
jgi:hypothetical protein